MPAARNVRRVPLDFDEPLKATWRGYVRPPEASLPLCPDCSYGPGMGTHGHSPQCHHMIETFWSHNFPEGSKHLAWKFQLGQADIDHLVQHNFFRKIVRVEKCEKYPNGWYYENFVPTLAEVMAANALGSKDFHNPLDLNSGAALLLAEFRCERIGLPVVCKTCKGSGHTATPEQEVRYDRWTPTEPPEGPGYQLWQSVSEGGPVSPVFETEEGLAAWMTTPANDFGTSKHETITYEDALFFVRDTRPLVMYPID